MFQVKFVRRSLLRALVLIVFAIGWTANARADCPTAALPMTFTYGTIGVSNSLAIGDVIPGTVKSFTLAGKCVATTLASKPVVACPQTQSAVAGMTGVYTTGLPGVGMRMRDVNGKPLVGTGACSTDSSLGNTGTDGSFNLSGTFELVKTGAITAGAISSSSAYYATGVLNTSVTLNDGNYKMSVASGTAVRPVTCSVTSETANQTVALSPVSTSALNSAGAVAGSTPFSIGLNCDAGVKVAVTYSSTSGNSGVASVLASTGTATDVGVQLLDSAMKPIVLDNPLQISSGTTGNASFQFHARYYRLGAASVKSGTVNSTAIFTMSYQ